MGMSRVVHYLLALVFLAGVVGGAGGQAVLAAPAADDGSLPVLANQEEPQIEEKLEIIAKYPVLKGKSGDKFTFELELAWHSNEFREFDVTASGPPDWNLSILGGYEKKEITGRIGLEPLQPGKTYPTEKVTIQLVPEKGTKPEPGEYLVTFEISSGDIHESVELKAVVTAVYEFDFYPVTGRLNTEVTAGEDNYLSLKVVNFGTATLESIRLSSSKPEGWSITFNPDKVESLEPGLSQEVEVVIKPPRQTIAGDYRVTLYAESEEFSADPLKLRVTVLTPTIWGWVGILIVLAVIAGVGVIFRRLGRR